MSEKMYKGYILDISQRDKKIFDTLNVTNKASIWLGLITVYEIKAMENEHDGIIKACRKTWLAV